MYKIDNVYSSVWISIALLSYEKYLSLLLNNEYIIKLKDFYFSQVDIQNLANQISINEVQSARISQWCNGSHKHSTYNYLVSRKSDKKRRLSLKGEFSFIKELPRDSYSYLKLDFTINNKEIKISYPDLLEWVENTYYSFSLDSDDSDIYIEEKINRATKDKKSIFTDSTCRIDKLEKFIVSEELSGTDYIYDGIINFLNDIQENKIEIYNEFSLQHELGIFLRQSLTHDLKIQFERNVYYFFNTKEGFTKREIDLSIFDEDFSKRFCIELKFPRNGQYPEQMFNICKDIKFLEELKSKGFTNCYSLSVVEDRNFYTSNKVEEEKIYKYFRNNVDLHGKIIKPTGNRDETLHLDGIYSLTWKNLNDYKFLLIKI